MKLLVQKTIFTLFLATCIIKGYAQIGINTDDPDTSAILDIRADKKGVLFPRIEQGDIGDMPKKDALFYYNNDTKRFYYYNASKSNWQCINPFNSSDPAHISAPGNLVVNSNSTVKNNQTVKNKLTVESTLDNNAVMKVDQSEIELNKGLDVNDTMAVKNKVTVEKGKLSVDEGDVEVKNGNLDVNNGEITGRGTVPVGTIVMWGKGEGEIPSNWQICDGTKVGSIQTPDLTDRFIVAGNNSTSTGKIAHRKSIYTTDPEECEWQHYIYTFNVSWRESERDYNKDVTYLGNSKPTIKSVKEDHCRSYYEPCSASYKGKKINPNYYIDNSDCRVNEFKELKKHKLIFIMRVE